MDKSPCIGSRHLGSKEMCPDLISVMSHGSVIRRMALERGVEKCVLKPISGMRSRLKIPETGTGTLGGVRKCVLKSIHGMSHGRNIGRNKKMCS